MVPSLCAALEMKEGGLFPEEVVTALNPLGDPRSIEILREMVAWRPDWDEYHALAVKAVWALCRMDRDLKSLIGNFVDDDRPVIADLVRARLGLLS